MIENKHAAKLDKLYWAWRDAKAAEEAAIRQHARICREREDEYRAYMVKVAKELTDQVGRAASPESRRSTGDGADEPPESSG